MQTIGKAGLDSVKAVWAGRVMSGLVIAFMIFDSGIQVLAFDFVTKGMAEFGIPVEFARPIGLVALACTVLYAIPATSALGAVLLTGFLGGAIATHLRGAGPLLPHVISALVIGLFVWGGLWLRNPQLRSLVPLLRS
ncbi:MAG TPA: DoxX family protein [Pseudolabrys sp.]|nr:DoxX family protein [Pseudolabrys sp.]